MAGSRRRRGSERRALFPRTGILWLVGLSLCGAAAARAPAAPDAAWAAPEFTNDGFDWIELGSGEWLKGDFERLRERKVSFDSDELDTLELDFSDISRFRLPRPHSYRLESRVVHRGSGEMKDGRVRVQTPAGPVEFGRGDLVSIVQGAGRERDRWSTKLGLGLAARRGNTDQVDLSGSLKVRRETALTRASLDYNGVISTVNDQKTADSHRAAVGLDVYLTKRFYLTPFFFEFFRDEFQNISRRLTPGAGLGYEFVREPWIEWDGNVGAAFQSTRFTGSGTENDMAAIVGTQVDFDFAALEWDNGYQLQLVATNLGRTSHHFDSVVSFDIWGPLDFDVSFIWDRIADPQPDANGVKPKSDDVRLTVGLGLDF